MKPFKSVDEILSFAITAEQEAADFYIRLSAQSLNIEMKQIFNQYAHEEMSHKARLITMREQGLKTIADKQMESKTKNDYLADVIPGPYITFTDALLLAIKKEDAAYRLYIDLASGSPDDETRSAFMALAYEEDRHKRRFEVEYNQSLLHDN